jgi:hypothetical protein
MCQNNVAQPCGSLGALMGSMRSPTSSMTQNVRFERAPELMSWS